MRAIERTSHFRRDYKREAKGRHRKTLDADLIVVLQALAADRPLDIRHRDHELTGNWRGFRDCHLRPDLVLIYERSNSGTLTLVRLGSHSELGL